MNQDDILEDSIDLFVEKEEDDGRIYYGPLVLTTAPKEGKANTLLADHLFSPSLLLAERIERGLIPLAGKSMIELGAGCALPSLLSSTLLDPPSLIVITDYPDAVIMGNLKQNVERNALHVSTKCTVKHLGYSWGAEICPLLQVVSNQSDTVGGFDIVILSDLLHFDSCHDILLSSLALLLRKSSVARTYVAAGKYTPATVCDHFLREAEKAGLVWEEGEDDPVWRGSLDVRGGALDHEQLGVRKGMCRWWEGKWAIDFLPQ